MEHIYSKEFQLRYFEMDKFGMASPTAILTLLEETAADHCHLIEHDLYSLENQNIGWVLISGSINMKRYPKYKEIIKIQTWLSKFSLVKGYRENLIIDEGNNIIGMAKGVWVFYDIQNRKPVPVFDDIKTKWSVNSSITAEIDIKLIKPILSGIPEREFDVQRNDVDSNKHVNNIKYFHWLLESLPEEISEKYVLETITAKFYSDAKYGDRILVYADKNSEDNSFSHAIKSTINNKTLAGAYSKWRRAG